MSKELDDFAASYRKHVDELQACTLTFIDRMEAVKAGADSEAQSLWNAAFHVNIVAHDLAALSYVAMTTDDNWCILLTNSLLAMMVVEAMEDIPKLFGGDYRNACKVKKVHSDDILKLNAVMKDIAAFRQAHDSELRKIRNAAGAHKNLDTFEMVRMRANVDGDVLIGIVIRFYDLLKKLGSVTTPILVSV